MERPPNTKRQSLGLGLLRFLLPIGVFFAGAYGLYRYHFNLKLYAVPFAAYARTLPDRDWIELQDTQLDLTEAVFTKSFGSPNAVYIPMRASGQSNDTKVRAMLLARDKATLSLVKRMRALSGKDAWNQFVEKNREQLFLQRTVRGWAQSWPDDPTSKLRQRMTHLHGNLDWEFVVFEEGKPSSWPWLLLFIAGFPSAWFCWFCPKMWT